MISITAKLAVLALCIAHLSSAVPTRPLGPRLNIIPENNDVSHIAVDETNGEYIAYRRDWSVYGVIPFDAEKGLDGRALPIAKRQASTCSDLSVEEAQTLPGWSKMVAQAVSNWGTGSYNLETNPPEYLDSPAQACISQTPVSLALNGNPNCVTSQTTADSQLVGTSGSVSLSTSVGFTASSSNTVTKESSIAQSATLSIEIEIPELFKFTGSETTTGTFTNTESNQFTTGVSSTTTQTFNANAPEGQTCHLQLDSTTCDTTGTGSIQTTAQGYVWFNFNSATDGHYKWALSIENTLTDVNDRSSSVSFTSSMTGNSNANYTAVCA